MKTLINLCIALLFTTITFGQNPFNLVFDVTSSDPGAHHTTIRHLKFMATNEPDSKLDIVIYSGSIAMVLANKSEVEEDLVQLSKNENITFKVCSSTMKRHNISPSMLIKGVEIVDNPLRAIFNRQQEGWGYIKETNN